MVRLCIVCREPLLSGSVCAKCITGKAIDVAGKEYDVGKKHDTGKRRYSLVPHKAMTQFVDVLTFGAVKYGDHNWKHVPMLQNRYYDALQRHVAAYRDGESYDEESGLHHLAHAMCCLAFMMQADIDGEL